MNKEKFLAYFKKKSQGKNETDRIQINFSDRKYYFCRACLRCRGDAKNSKRPKKYQVVIPAKINSELGL